jgi:hypothetical protein
MNKRQLAHALLDKLIDAAEEEFVHQSWDFDVQLLFLSTDEDEHAAENHIVYRGEIVTDVNGVAHLEEAARVETNYMQGIVYNRDYDDIDVTIQ